MKNFIESFKIYFFGIVFLGIVVILPPLLIEKIFWKWSANYSIDTTKYILISYALFFVVFLGILIPIIQKISRFLGLKKKNFLDNINTVIIFLVSSIPLITAIKMTVFLMEKIPKYKYFSFHYGASVILFFEGIKINIFGKPDEMAKIVIANHTSESDYILLPWVMGTSPFNILAGINIKENKKTTEDKIVSWALGGLVEDHTTFINREDSRSMLQAFLRMAKEIKNGKRFAIFPEGTRLLMSEIRGGKILSEFKKGAFWLAWKEKISIQPVALCFPAAYRGKEDHRWGVHPRAIDVYYLDIVRPENFNSIEDFMEECFSVMEEKIKNSKKVKQFLDELNNKA